MATNNIYISIVIIMSSRNDDYNVDGSITE